MMEFEDLEVWQRSKRLSVEIYQGLKNLRDYSFKDQITRASLSIPSNIAEGFERESVRECLNFLSYAKGSCGELRTQVVIGMDIGYVPEEKGNHWALESREISSMLSGLIKTKKRFLKSALQS